MKNLFFMRQDEKKERPLAISTQDFFQKNLQNPSSTILYLQFSIYMQNNFLKARKWKN